ncbi:MAG: YitT family protein [Bacteroidaceae bacterium]|nr:YitT family protein [Bacteroidaceae bacterium]
MNKKDIAGIIRDYTFMLVGIAFFTIGYTCFMLPYEITSGGMGGVAALIFYATGFPAQYGYFIINLILLSVAFWIMGWRYTARTLVANVIISFGIGLCQDLITQPDGTLSKLVGDEMFMACVLAGCFEGVGLALVFQSGGSTGGSDIIASCINKYRDMQLGRIMLFIDLIIVGCGYFVVHDVEKMLVGYIAMFISMTVLDYVLNSANQSVQFTIISSQYSEIADSVNRHLDRGVTVLNGSGWYSKEERQVLLILAKKREKRRIMQLIRYKDPSAFVSVSNVEGVFGEGFDRIKN